jgi:type IV secretory pathway VirB10-like protein
MTVKAVLSREQIEAEVEARRKRAEEALASGKYRVQRIGKGQWRVENGDGTAYTVAVQDGKPSCDCPDFRNRGSVIGTCKHIEMIRALVRNSKPAQPAKPAQPSQSASGPSAPTPPTPNGRTDRAPEAPAAPSTPQSTEDPEAVAVHWGKHKGKTLGQLAREAPGFIAWLAFKMEARSDEDRRLQEAARKVHDRLKLKAEKGEKKARQSRGADPVAGFIAAAGIELLKELWKAQSGGRDLSDPVIEKALELRVQAIRRVAELLRQI